MTLLFVAGEAKLTLLFASLQHVLTAFAFITLHRCEVAARGIALQCGEYELQLIQEGCEWLTSQGEALDQGALGPSGQAKRGGEALDQGGPHPPKKNKKTPSRRREAMAVRAKKLELQCGHYQLGLTPSYQILPHTNT